MFRIYFYPLFGSTLFILLCAGTLAAFLWYSRPSGEQMPRFGQRILLALRAAALLLLLFAMLRPTLVHTVSHRLAAAVFVLCDQSQSMSRNDEIGGKTRFDAAKDALENAVTPFKTLQRQTELKAFTFDAALKPLTIQEGAFTDLPDKPVGTETAIGSVLDSLREQSAGKRVLGIIMLTDGTQRARPSRDILPQDAAGRLRDAGMPLYAVPLGQAGLVGNTRDISVDSMQANDRVFVKNKFLITGTLRVSGFSGQRIPVNLLFEDENRKTQTVHQTEVRAAEDGQFVPYRLEYAPQKPGLYKYTVKVPPQEKELSERNNEQSGFVRVIEGGLRILFIQGPRNFEQGPLRQSLNASPDLNVNYLRIDKKGSAKEALQDPVPYNVFIFDSIDSSMFLPEELTMIAEQVKAGAGLIMLGGLYAFGAGGYAVTPLADVSPVELSPADKQPLNAPIRQDIHWAPTIPIPMRLTESGKRHFVLRLDAKAEKNEERWAKLPPILGANRWNKLKKGATLLAEGPDGQKLLASQMYGLGRVLAFAGDTTYRWRLSGFAEEHKTFWRQVVLWLAKMEGGGSGDCWITVENNRLFPGDAVKFQVFMRNEEGEEVRNFSAKASVLKSDNNTESVPMIMEDGVPTGSFRSTEFSGDYTITAAAEYKGETKSATARFLVQSRNLELDNPVAYPKLLADISQQTGGKSVPPEQLAALLEELMKQGNELAEKRETKTSLFDSWWLLLLFVGIMSAEWFLRKRWGLV